MSAFDRLGSVTEIAAVVAIAAGDDARRVTLQLARITGGPVDNFPGCRWFLVHLFL